jgi:outer membrane protein assembly factor BamB
MKRVLILIIAVLLISITFNVSNNGSTHPADSTFTPTSQPLPRSRGLDSWSMFSHDLYHSGNSSASAPATNSVLWCNSTGDLTGAEAELYSSPTVYDGKVYIGTRSSYVYCFDEDTGETLWTKKFDKVTWGICGTPTIVNDKLFIGTEDEKVYCLDPNNGDMIWNYTTQGPVWSSAAVFNNKVYIGSHDRELYCLDEETGALIWQFSTNHTTYGYQDYGVCSSPSISNGRLFVGACDGNCYSLPLDDPNGDGVINQSEKIWSFDTGCYVYGSPTVFNGRVYIGTGTYKRAVDPAVYKLFCLDEITGAKLWEFQAGSHFLSTPAIAYGNLYIGSLDGNFYCLPLVDPNGNGVISDTELIWQFEASNVIWSSPAVADGRVYFSSGAPNWETGDGDYSLFCLPLNDSNHDGVIDNDELIWSYKLDSGSLTSPAVVNNKLFISTYDGKVYCFADGAALPKIKSIYPEKDSINVSLDINITAKFSNAINPNTLTTSTFYIVDENLETVPANIEYNAMDNLAILDPTSDLEENMVYNVTLTTAIQDMDGNGLDSDGDGIFEPEEVYTWSFATAIYPPEISKIPVQRPVHDEDWALNMSVYVHDANTPFKDLVITENSTYAQVTGALIIFNYPSGVLTELVNVTVSDGTTTTWQVVKVEVKVTNSPPTLLPIPDVQAVEDVNKTINLSEYVSDIDNEQDELIVIANSTFVTVNGLAVTFNYPEGILTDLVNISVSDGIETDHQYVNVNVTPVNDAPEIHQIPDLLVIEDKETLFDITSHIFDIDTPIIDLEVYSSSEYVDAVKDSIENITSFVLVLNYPDGLSSERVELTVTDGDKASSFEFNVAVEPVNDPPHIFAIPDQLAVEDVNFIIDLSWYIYDVDTPEDDLELIINSDYLIKTNGLKLTFNYPDGIKEEIVNVTIVDDNYKFYFEFLMKIYPVNDPPRLFNESVTPSKGDTGTEFIFSVTYMDIDGENIPKVELVVDDKVYLLNLKNEGNLSLAQEYSCQVKLGKGRHYYYFRGDDNSGSDNSTSSTPTAIVEVSSEPGSASDALVFGIAINILIMIILSSILFLKFKLSAKQKQAIKKRDKRKTKRKKR